MHLTKSLPIHKNVSLKALNTFGLDVKAAFYAEINAPEDLLLLAETATFQQSDRMILGGGSNVLFTSDFQGLIIANRIGGIATVSSDQEHVMLRAGAGVVWDHLVQHSLREHLGGLENLSMIPGLTGAAPIQNIGAYGVELEQVFEELEALDLQTGEKLLFDRTMCQFGYRDSIFKHAWRNRCLITHVTLRLRRNPELQLGYGAIKNVLEQRGCTQPDIHDVSQAIRHIRSEKLPDPARIGNAGSFFKNPVITASTYQTLCESWPGLPGWSAGPGHMKIPAAWLIEHCGFKGVREGDAGVHENHALILVNYANARGSELLALARRIQGQVQATFGIALEPEVRLVPDSSL